MARPSLIDLGFQLAPVGLLVTRNRTVHRYNLQFSKLFRYEPRELIGASLELLYPSHDDFVRVGNKWLTLMARTGEYADERLMRKSDGTVFWCHVAGRAVDADRPFERAVWYFAAAHPAAVNSRALSPRERQVAALLVQGMTSKQAAQRLGLSPRTVEMHRARLMRRLDVRNVAALMQKLLT